MGRVRRVLLNAAIYFVYFFLSCVLVMLIEALFLRLLDRFVLLSYLAQTVIRLVIYSLGVPALVGLAAYAEGYREADAHPGETVVSGLLAVLIASSAGAPVSFQAVLRGRGSVFRYYLLLCF